MKNQRIVYSTDDENFNIDSECEALQIAIDESYLTEIEVGDKVTYYKAVAREFEPSDFVTDHRINSFIEDMNCAACDEAGEYAEDFGYCDPAAKEELRTMIAQWADKHLTCSFWGVEKSEEIEVVVTQEMLDQ